MKPILSFALLSALAAVAAHGAVTVPVGFYNFDGKAGGNLFVPGFVEPSAFAGAITGNTATTLTVGAGALTAGAFDEGATYATHYVEITSGPNAGVNIDIASNTDSVITLDGDVSGLSLTGSETIVVRPHVTLKSALEGGEASFSAFTDAATFYESNGTPTTYLYDGAGGWSSDFSTPDGNDRPIPPATGFVLGLFQDTTFEVVGEVKESQTVVQLFGAAPNIVGPTNPLVGDSTQLDALGFQNMTPFTDAITLYVPGTLAIIDTYLADGGGNVIDGGFNPSNAALPHTTGGILTAAGGDSALTIQSGVTVAP